MKRLWHHASLGLSILAAIGLAVLVVRVSAIGILAQAPPQLAEQVIPGDPDTVFAGAMQEYATRRGRISDATWHRVQRAATLEPLAAPPFVVAAVRATAAGDGRRATLLLQEARRRNPRDRIARVLLMERYAREQRIAEVIVELAALNRLVRQGQSVLVDVLALAVADPTAADAVFRTVQDPVTLNGLLTKLVANGTPTEIIIRLSTNLPKSNDSYSLEWRRALLDRLVREGRYNEAHRLWRVLSGPDAATSGLIYNSDFTRRAALPPFNWRLASETIGAAEIGSRHVLSVEYFGRQTGELAGQLLLLAPGTYQLAMDIEGRVDAESTKMIWGIHCAVPGKEVQDGPKLLGTVLASQTAQKRRLTKRFTVPRQGCPAQWLTLQGVAAEFPTSQSIEISRLVLQRVG